MKVSVVGGGAAGLMAAGAALRQGHEVTVLEHMEKPAQKILVTGKGRCNVTNDCTAEEFLHHVRTNPRFLFSSLGAFPPAKTMELFESLGVELKVERGRRVFPVSDKAEEIRQALLRYAEGADIVRDGAKKLLLEHNPERFSFYLSGACATNHIRSEPEQRLRLHRVSQTLITMRNANVSIFRDEKLGVFRPGETATGSICTPAFYSSREIKEMGTTFVKIRGARSVGVLLTPQHIHVVYNMGNALMKWSYKAEMRTKALMQTVLCRERMPHQYHPDAVRGLLLGDSMELAYELLTDQGGKNYFVLDGSYERFCFLTNDHHGEVLLRLLCDKEIDNDLRELLLLDLEPRQLSETVENDAMTPDGAPVLFAYDCDLPRIRRFDTALRLQDRYGILICFDHQAEVLRRYCGDRAVVQAIDFAAFERRFFP